MKPVYVIGVGMTRVGRLYEKSGRDLAAEAVLAAIKDSGGIYPRALVVGNMSSSVMMEQDSLGALVADYSGLRGIPAYKVEAACGSGGAALYSGVSLVLSGLVDTVAVVGVEKLTEYTTAKATKALAQAMDAEYELFYGASFTGLNALVARLYMNTYGYSREDMAHWPLRMHEYASYNPYAQLPKKTTLERILKSPVVADPLHLFDCSPLSDGAAAVIITSSEEVLKKSLSATGRDTVVEIAGIAMATDSVDLGSRRDLLTLSSTVAAAKQAYRIAGLGADAIDYAEVHDAFHITGYLALEDLGFAEKGKAVEEWKNGRFGRGDKPEVNFSGGLKARGHPVGATGVYQVAEATMQLRGDFPGYKASDPEVALTQNIGGVGTFTIVTILRRRR